ncbi:heterokaryon incompatibility protein (HET) domain-containing protein [Trichoderma breve]|uniref:Heterokaryon incompatibility protein (HET) domain-containing protein n=1 Tax=Trichoderma breve TaxID=2034170 RepID=A0A9W9B423_9HYPO|nr:heterokaryon incompatibility protein (HET) domain-containing protein [Trichoderma breve]KAJ4855732.1 heterokaryon incompatibility protein (HET) domain-containing protein [Trichoderma breve]
MAHSAFGITYEAVDSQGDDHRIRTLTLTPSQDPSEPIHISLSVAKLNDDPSFEALSYCWGDATDKLLIFCNGVPFPVTKNLESALRHLRQTEDERTLWIDAICINQDNIPERNYQVSIMKDIYRKARHVVIWLGDAGEDLYGPNKKKLMNQRLAAAKRRHELAKSTMGIGEVNSDAAISGTTVQSPAASHRRVDVTDGAEADDKSDATSKEITAFFRLLLRPWFSRCWVVQEACLAQEASVQCGNKSIGWPEFYMGFILSIIMGTKGLEGRPDRILRGGLVSIMMVKGEMLFADPTQQGVDLLWLLRKVLPLNATDPRDKIYSILGLVKGDVAQEYGITPDYTLSVEECYKKAAMAVMSQTENLDALVLDHATSSPLKLPSWVPDWSHLPSPAPVIFALDSEKMKEPVPINASKSQRWIPVLKDDGGTLCLSGYDFDQIVELEDILTVPRIDQVDLASMTSSVADFKNFWKSFLLGLGTYFDTLVKWEQLAMSKRYAAYPTGETQEMVFAITMCTGNVESPELAVKRFRKWQKSLRGPRLMSGFKYLGMKGGFYKSLVAAASIGSGMSTADDRVYATGTEKTLYRRLARTKKGYLAVVPSQSRVGDQISLYEGGKFPFVVRTRTGQGPKQLVGPCYVHGIMYGEAWDQSLCQAVEII